MHNQHQTPKWACDLLEALAERALRDAQSDCDGEVPPLVVHQLEHLIELVQREIGGTLTNLERKLDMSSATVIEAMANLDTKVTALRTASDSMEALLKGIAQQLRENRGDPVAIDAIAARIGEETDEIVASVLENTPVVPNP